MKKMFGRIFQQGQNPQPFSQQRALKKITANGVEIRSVIDVGAAKGDWSRMAREFWPDAAFHLIEAKEQWRGALDTYSRNDHKSTFKIAGVTNAPGIAYFENGADAFGGAAYKEPTNRGEDTEIPATSIDHEVERLALQPPFAIKLDTHGTEADILKGAEQTLNDTTLLCIETYNLIGQLHFADLIILMRDYGFGCVDLADPLFRPRDGALWQIDFYFLRNDHAIFADASFS